MAIIGKPNAGKSTLLNGLLGAKLSIVTPKAQTTRHRIIGVHSGPGFQAILLDTPGILRPVSQPVRALPSDRHTLLSAHACPEKPALPLDDSALQVLRSC